VVKCTKREVRKLRTALRWKLAALQRQRIQMVLLRESGMTQPAIAEAMGVSLSTVNRAHMAYDQGGLEARKEQTQKQGGTGKTRPSARIACTFWLLYHLPPLKNG
jgi:predicted ArsR family transcriptional regulator